VEALDETVVVQAGTFNHCIKLGSMNETGNHTWFARGVGLVKAVAVVSVERGHFKAGEYVMELTAFSK
jgi:hypothetical protein